MKELGFWKAVVLDEANMIEELVSLLEEHRVAYCVIGGQAVNAYVEPLVSMDLDLVIAANDIDRVDPLLRERFTVESFEHSLNLSLKGSGLRVQVQKDPRYSDFVSRARRMPVLGVTLAVAALEDVLQGKVWAALDPGRRPSKRQKDLADIARILESHPELRTAVPAELLERLVF